MPTSKKRAPSPEKTAESTNPPPETKTAVPVAVPVAAIDPQPFPWLSVSTAKSVKHHSDARNLEVRRREISDRAGLLRRLGYSQTEVLIRLRGYQDWEYEPFHKSPLGTEVTALVEAVFAPAKGRVSTLQP